MALPRLKEIAGRLQHSAAEAGTKFSFTMVTNGTLLTRAVAEELVPLGFTAAQLTLDGPPEIHDLQRPFVSGKGSFTVIARNIRDVCDLITVHVGGNFTPDNYREFPRMLDLLLAEGIDPQRSPRSSSHRSCRNRDSGWGTTAAASAVMPRGSQGDLFLQR